jgi:hypothetical protein
MMLKQTFKKLVGELNYERASLLQKYLKVFSNRAFRYRKTVFSEKKARSNQIEKFSASRGQTFFGYYDVTPFSKNNNMILANIGPDKNRSPIKGEELLVGYFYRDADKHFQPVDKTSTWCWQMGCRLQWFPEDENNLVIYNKMVDKIYGSVIQDIKNKKILTTLQRPIYQIDKHGKHALSLNFSRLNRLRPGYGYSAISDPFEGNACPEGDGVWLMNIHSGKNQLILTLKQLSKMDPLQTMEGAEHYVNHLAFNPSGNRCMLLHLWINNGRRYNRLITCDLYGKNICILTTTGLVSHYTWKSDRELLITLYHENVGTNYYLIKDSSDERTKIGDGLLQEDGHPSYSPNSSSILTDTYPDNYGEQRLLLYTSEQNLIEIARFFSPTRFRGEMRCDLHPRWDRNGRNVCIDSAQEGTRSLYVISLGENQISRLKT